MATDYATGLTVCPFVSKHMMPNNSMKKHLVTQHFKEVGHRGDDCLGNEKTENRFYFI